MQVKQYAIESRAYSPFVETAAQGRSAAANERDLEKCE